MNTSTLSRPGTLVRARGREWMVLPESTDDVLLVRPLGGLDEETVGILPDIEPVESATFSLPTAADLGDFRSSRLLREAARLTTRAAAGPFRSFGRIAVEPRPYQLVPLIMALRLDPVRLLIADDVGIGKTVEAALVARELLDRGDIRRLAVLCPPHLAEQWQKELLEKFHVDAELILSGTIQRLERNLPIGASVFDRHPFVIVSTDFMKGARRADEFALRCPEFVIVDEAHGCTLAGGIGRSRQQRHDLVRKIAGDPERHLVLVTATPHSGDEGAFRSLLSLLDPEFSTLPADLTRETRESVRRKLAQHLVQRRRGDIRSYLETETTFPRRLEKEEVYAFSPDYEAYFGDIVRFVRGYVNEREGGERQRRVRYWSALALLRCVSSSPAAAAATLRNRAFVDEAADPDIDIVGRETVLDEDDVDAVAIFDLNPGTGESTAPESVRRKLLEFARRAETLKGAPDAKLQGALRQVKGLLQDGFRPIVFCRFVETAEYVAEAFRQVLPSRIRVESVTGLLPGAEREQRIAGLAEGGGQYVLVCTDCLSEGINLQDHFNAVLHYDLCWNPTRHEQREGRVDRFGQGQPEVRIITYYGQDNPIDGVILDVLIRRHRKIKSDLGVSVAVPTSSARVAEALFQGALFREDSGRRNVQLPLDFGDSLPQIEAIHEEWEDARRREKVNRSIFAQQTVKTSTVAEELARVRQAIGRNQEVRRFFLETLRAAGIPFDAAGNGGGPNLPVHVNGPVKVHLGAATRRALRQALGRDEPFVGRFDLPVADSEIYLGRTSPLVEGLAGWVLDQALDRSAREPGEAAVAARCGVLASRRVGARTTLLLARFRYHLHTTGGQTLLCEENVPCAFTGLPSNPQWLSAEDAEALVGLAPDQNLTRTLIDQQTGLLEASLPEIRLALEPMAKTGAQAQLEAHLRVRQAAGLKGRASVAPVLPVDILGAYVILVAR